MTIQEERKPSIGLKITAIFLGINAVLLCGSSITSIIMNARSTSSSTPNLILAILMLILAISYGFASVGLWQMKIWAWKLAIVIICLILVPAALSLARHGSFANVAGAWYLFLYPVTLIYLLLPSTKEIIRGSDDERVESLATERKRIPVGVAIIAVILALNALILFISAFMRFFSNAKYKGSEPAWVMTVSMFIVALLFCWIAIGLRRLKNWARIATAIMAAAVFASMISIFIKQRIFPDPLNWWHFYIYPIVLIYLFLPAANRAFRK